MCGGGLSQRTPGLANDFATLAMRSKDGCALLKVLSRLVLEIANDIDDLCHPMFFKVGFPDFFGKCGFKPSQGTSKHFVRRLGTLSKKWYCDQKQFERHILVLYNFN